MRDLSRGLRNDLCIRVVIPLVERNIPVVIDVCFAGLQPLQQEVSKQGKLCLFNDLVPFQGILGGVGGREHNASEPAAFKGGFGDRFLFALRPARKSSTMAAIQNEYLSF